MKHHLWKKFILVLPLIILVLMMIFINYTVQFFKDMSCTYIYDTNVGSVRRFAEEIEILSSEEYTGEDYYDLYTHMIHIYNKSLGERDVVITFLADDEVHIYHSNDHNAEFLSGFLDEKANMDHIKHAVMAQGSGEIKIKNGSVEEPLYYQTVTNGKEHFYLFMTLDSTQVGMELNANQIIIPICIIGLLLLFMTHSNIWMKTAHHPTNDPVKDPAKEEP